MKKVLLIVLGIVITAIVVAGIIAQVKFGALIAAPKVSYDTQITPQTRAIALLDVPQMKSFIKKKLLHGKKVPDWVVSGVLPYEAAFFISPNAQAGELNYSLFINNQRMAPVITQQTAKANIGQKIDFIQWATTGLTQKKPGVLTMEGVGKIPAEVKDIVTTQWANAKVDQPLKAEGGHLFEVVLDNRDGGALTAITSILSAKEIPLDRMKSKSFMDIIASIAEMRVSTDLTSDDGLGILLTINFKEGTSPLSVLSLKQLFDMGFGFVKGSGRVQLEGESTVKDLKYEGRYKISNLSELLGQI